MKKKHSEANNDFFFFAFFLSANLVCVALHLDKRHQDQQLFPQTPRRHFNKPLAGVGLQKYIHIDRCIFCGIKLFSELFDSVKIEQKLSKVPNKFRVSSSSVTHQVGCQFLVFFCYCLFYTNSETFVLLESGVIDDQEATCKTLIEGRERSCQSGFIHSFTPILGSETLLSGGLSLARHHRYLCQAE